MFGLAFSPWKLQKNNTKRKDFSYGISLFTATSFTVTKLKLLSIRTLEEIIQKHRNYDKHFYNKMKLTSKGNC